MNSEPPSIPEPQGIYFPVTYTQGELRLLKSFLFLSCGMVTALPSIMEYYELAAIIFDLFTILKDFNFMN